MRCRVQRMLDKGYGACWLSNPGVANVVEQALPAFDRDRYRLWARCIMPNHVHVLFEALNGCRLADVVKSWKAYSAAKANRLMARKGAFWQPDYFDRYMRNEEQMSRTIDYIERNPAQAGLCQQPSDWRWSSAFRKKTGRSVLP
ncbi:REP-associated tyrosine transposase [Labrys okinawensis]|uniref:REP-associated tyrosine transposase n=1 Tax=Labrys okinawensis TaxID=346911 RepID=UPI0039BCF97F